VKFRTNDDLHMFFVSNGETYGEPSSELVFTGQLIGQFITLLEQIVPNLNWYPIIMATSLVLALTVIGLVILEKVKQCNMDYLGILALIAFLLFGLNFILILQFTQTAVLCTAAGAISLMHRKVSKFEFIVGSFLVLLGVSWRPEAGILVVLLLGFTHVIFQKKKETQKNNLIIFYIALIAVAAFMINASTWNTSVPWVPIETKEFIKFNAVRGELHSSYYLGTIDSFKDAAKLGLSSNDWSLFKYFYTGNPEIYNINNLSPLAEKTTNFQSISDFKNMFYFFKKPLLSEYQAIIALFLISASAGILLLLRSRIFLFGWFLTVFSLYLIYLFRNMPIHLFLPIMYICAVNMWLETGIDASQNEGRKSKINNAQSSHYSSNNFSDKITASFLILIILGLAFNTLKVATSNINSRNPTPELNLIRNFVSDKPIVSFPSFYTAIIDIDPFSDVRSTLPIVYKLIGFGSSTGSPRSNKHLQELGLSQDLFRNVFSGKAYLGVASEQEIKLVQNYGYEHFGLRVVFQDLTPTLDSQKGMLRILKIIQ